jgi:transposase
MHIQEDSITLRELAAKCKDAKERERLRALYALSIGQSVATITNIFCVDESTIYRWIGRWESEKSLADNPKQGRPPLLDEDDKAELKDLVEENNPKRHGINASFWDTKEIQTYFMNNGKEVSRETIRNALKCMGARYVKAQLLYPEADENQRRQFAEQFHKEMASKPKSVIVLFQDEMSAGCPPPQRIWLDIQGKA